MLAMALSGALAGMVGVNEALGYRYRYYHEFRRATDSPASRWLCSGAIIPRASCSPPC